MARGRPPIVIAMTMVAAFNDINLIFVCRRQDLKKLVRTGRFSLNAEPIYSLYKNEKQKKSLID
jgi:hypothetical protein